MDKDLFYETILPLLGIKDAALIAISTPLSELNWFSALLSAKTDDGEFFFKIVRLATVCKKCQKLPSEQAILCDHQKDIIPPWKSGPRQDRLKALADLDSADRFARENAGLVVGGEETVFPRELVSALFADDATTPWFRVEDAGVAVGEGYRPDCLYTVADPNAGGSSALAVMTGFIVHAHPTIRSGTLVVRGPSGAGCFVFFFLLCTYTGGPLGRYKWPEAAVVAGAAAW